MPIARSLGIGQIIGLIDAFPGVGISFSLSSFSLTRLTLPSVSSHEPAHKNIGIFDHSHQTTRAPFKEPGGHVADQEATRLLPLRNLRTARPFSSVRTTSLGLGLRRRRRRTRKNYPFSFSYLPATALSSGHPHPKRGERFVRPH
jgi:hypothetical protein